MVPLSILIRNKDSRYISTTLNSLKGSIDERIEIIVVDSSANPLKNDGVESIKIISFNGNRTEALIEGSLYINGKNVLILDSDQIIDNQLLNELCLCQNDMCIINEVSYNNNIIGKLSDMNRKYLFNFALKHANPMIPAIPRFYKTEVFKKAIANLPEENIKKIIQHEDSMIYYEAYKITNDLTFNHGPIYNVDPSFKDFLLKSYKYGVFNGAIKKNPLISSDFKKLFKTIDSRRIWYDKELGFNPGLILDCIKGVPYLTGELRSKLNIP